MPLSMTLNRSNKTPLLMPCFDGRELHVDSELVSAGLSAISVKGYDAGDPRMEGGIRHRNSFWSVHRPELSKLSWASNHKPQSIENYFKSQTGNQRSDEELKKSDIAAEDSKKLTTIHANSDQNADTDENYLLISKPRTTQFSDKDLASHTMLHKSRAEFCVTIGRLGQHSMSDISEPSSSKSVRTNNEGMNLFCENDPEKSIGSYDKQGKKLDENKTEATMQRTSKKMLIELMDDTGKDGQNY